MSLYSASKFAVRGLTQSLCKFWLCDQSLILLIAELDALLSTRTCCSQDHRKRLLPWLHSYPHAYVIPIFFLRPIN